jgi:hypothetical protein
VRNLNVDGKVIIQSRLKGYGVTMWPGFYQVEIVSCEECTEHSYPTKGGIFLDQLNDYQVLEKGSALWSYLCIETAYKLEIVHKFL